MGNWREDALGRLTGTGKSTDELFAELMRLTRELGFEYCSFGIRAPAANSSPSESWSTNYPDAWQRRYFESNYMHVDPILAQAWRTALPVIWGTGPINNEPAFWEDAQSHGVRYGWTVATWGRGNTTGLISVSRSAEVLKPLELSEVEPRLLWLAHTAHVAMSAAIEVPHALAHELTPREYEVLRWTAAGKTAPQIATLLGISERTVNFHVTAIVEKLDAVNKTQAAVTATLLGLLR
jgi:LuxR family transcriptional regulator